MQEAPSSPNAALPNGVLSIALAYLALGPPIALILACLSSNSPLVFLFFIFGIPASYIIGGLPAIFVGSVHGIVRKYIRQRTLRLFILPCLSAILVGLVILPLFIKPSGTPHSSGPRPPTPVWSPAPLAGPVPGSDPLPIIAAAAVAGLIVELRVRNNRTNRPEVGRTTA